MSHTYTDPFWKGLDEGEFRVLQCSDCAAVSFPPAPICPRCHSDAVDLTPSEGRGRLVAFTRQHRTAPGIEAPIVIGLLELVEGSRLLVRIDASYGSLAIGDTMAIEPWAYDEGIDRGRLTEHPYFRARPEP